MCGWGAGGLFVCLFVCLYTEGSCVRYGTERSGMVRDKMKWKGGWVREMGGTSLLGPLR
jgi:hypothetical protein